MKDMKITTHSSKGRSISFQFNKMLSSIMAFFLLFGMTQYAYAQDPCALNCNQSLQLSLGQDCEDEITYDMMTNCQGPASNYLVFIMRQNGVLSAPIVTGADVGKTLTVKVRRISDNNECWGYVKVEDKVGPVITCPADLTIYCGNSTDTSKTGKPAIVSECSLPTTIQFTDYQKSGNCTNPDTLFRTFVVKDRYGNVSSCQQRIVLIRPNLDLTAPGVVAVVPSGFADTTFYGCATSFNPHPDNTGYPRIQQPRLGVPGVFDTLTLKPGQFCNINVTYTDTRDTLCSRNTLKIRRTWRVMDNCFPTRWIMRDQNIILRDTLAPSLLVPFDTMRISTGSSNDCGGYVTLPSAISTDQCSNPVRVTATVFTPDPYSSGNVIGTVDVTNGPAVLPQIIPADTHYVVYKSFDLCGNVACDTSVLIMSDQTPPVAICRTKTVVSLTTDSFSRVPAITFDEGSYDNCCTRMFRVKRMSEHDSLFKQYIDFKCADIANNPIMVVMQVMDCAGNSNTCMVEVEIQDKVAPSIIAPPSVTVDCGGTYLFGSNLNDEYLNTNFGKVVKKPTKRDNIYVDIYGDGTTNKVFVGQDGEAYDNCDVTIVHTYEKKINNCGIGTIIRRWTATDPGNRQVSASQSIYVRNSTPFNGRTDIVWPKDTAFYTSDCTSNLDPSRTGRPVITEDACDQVLVTYSDEKFQIIPNYATGSPCYKVIRTWVVIDWCQYDAQTGTGRWSHAQALKVFDTSAPTITSAPTQDTTLTYGILTTSCVRDELILPAFTATDACVSAAVLETKKKVQTNFPAGTSTTDQYRYVNVPAGTYRVTYSVEDGCGNVAVRNFNVVVKDTKKPTPVCLFTTIQIMPTGMVRLDSFQVNNFSSDNCTPQNRLKIKLDTVPTVTTKPDTLNSFMIFTCKDVCPGGRNIRMWVGDESGNWDYCQTTVFVQDNNVVKACPLNSCDQIVATANVTGTVKTEMGDNVEKVNVMVNNANPFVTTSIGTFAFSSLNKGSSYTIKPEKDLNTQNGVSTADVVAINKHILDIEKLNSPYKIIAADVNKDGKISTSDLVELRKVILYVQNNFNNNSSWRFVDKQFAFPNPATPLNSGFPEVKSINGLSADVEANFVGIKVGDVNNSASANGLMMGEERSAGTLTIAADEKEMKANEASEITFYANEATTIEGYQFTLNFDPSKVEVIEVKSGKQTSADNFGMNLLANGCITTSWNGKSIEKGEELFTVKYRALTNGTLSNVWSINSRYTQAEAYTVNGEKYDVTLNFNTNKGSVATNRFELYQNQPNPFAISTVIGFNLPLATDAALTITDQSGKVLKTIKGQFAKGYNEISVSKEELGVSGVLYYQLSTSTEVSAKKMIILE